MRVTVVERPQTRGQTDHRRRRLHQLLERESLKTPDPNGQLRPSKSLPSLAQTQQHAPPTTAACPSPILTKCTPNLSPLRTQRQRPVTRQFPLRTARPRDELYAEDQEPTAPEDMPDSADDAHALIEQEAALVRQAEEWEKRRSRMIAKQYKAAQLEQIHDKQLRRRDRKLDAQQVAEQVAWEQTQLDLVDQSRRLARRTQLLELRESQVHSLEIDRRQASAAKIARDFFDRLAVMDATHAMTMFTAKQDELVACCMDLVQECVERHELDDFKEMLRETLQREELLLRHRMRAAEREEEVKAAKKRAVTDLKRNHFEEIQRHLAVTREGKTQQQLLRREVDKQQETLDHRYKVIQDAKKQRDLDVSAKLQQQMRRHRAEQAVVSLHVEGMTSPTLRTPFWCDESAQARLDTYERQSHTAVSPGRTTIFAKKTCQWYD